MEAVDVSVDVLHAQLLRHTYLLVDQTFWHTGPSGSLVPKVAGRSYISRHIRGLKILTQCTVVGRNLPPTDIIVYFTENKYTYTYASSSEQQYFDNQYFKNIFFYILSDVDES